MFIKGMQDRLVAVLVVSPGRKSIHCPMTFLQDISMYVHIDFYFN